MSAVKLASRYAKSLLDFAVEKGKLEDVYKDMQYMQSLMKESREFEVFLNSPIINPDKKVKVLKAIAEGKISEITFTFLQLLVKKSRELYLRDITESFIRMYLEYKKITKVKLTSAQPLKKDEIDKMLEKLKNEAMLENIQLQTEVDESLIGGFVLQYKDKQYDASISRQLEILKRELDNNDYIKKLR